MNWLFSLRSFGLALLSLLVVLSACDSGGSNESGPQIDNTFQLDISPVSGSSISSSKTVRDTTINGFSFFYDSTENDATSRKSFYIYFSGSESKEEIKKGLYGFAFRISARADTGSYNVGRFPSDTRFTTKLYENWNAGNYERATYYSAYSGTLKLTSSSSDKVEGQLQLQATALIPGGTEDTVSIDGSFTATSISTPASADS